MFYIFSKIINHAGFFFLELKFEVCVWGGGSIERHTLELNNVRDLEHAFSVVGSLWKTTRMYIKYYVHGLLDHVLFMYTKLRTALIII